MLSFCIFIIYLKHMLQVFVVFIHEFSGLFFQESNEQEQLDFKLLQPQQSPSAFVYNSNSVICVSGIFHYPTCRINILTI